MKERIDILIEDFREEYQKAVDEYPRLGLMLPFIAKLFLAGLVFRGILFLNPDTYFLQEYLAEVTAGILNFFGGSYQLQNALIIGENGNYLVTRDCLGWKSVSAFIGLIFASTSNFTGHLKTVLTGTLLLLTANLLRVVTTVWLSEAGVISFEIIHTFLWRWGMTAVVLLVWYIWLKNHRGREI